MRCTLTGAWLTAALVALAVALAPPVARAQDGGPVTGRVTDAQSLALPGVAVVLRTRDAGFVASATTDRSGAFEIPDVAAGEYVLAAMLLGFATHEQPIAVGAGGADAAISLEVGAFSQQVTVSALMPEVATELVITADEIERRVAQDLAQSLRDHAGVTALRRGAINLDPSVRGLYAEQIGVFVDGTRTFAAGPARMDSGLSHVSPHALQSLHVVRGPYALTWGAGTLSAIRADTFKPAFSGGAFEIGGRAGYNYGSNGGANDAIASLHGSSDRVRFTFQHNARTGNDYTDGAGATVQGDYESFDTRWSLGGRMHDRTLLEYTGGYQKQNDIDYPGRILDATLFETQSHALDFSHVRPSGLVSEIAGQVYLNAKSHVMNNDNKPTAVRNPQRTPPFPLDVHLPASSDTLGGRFHAALETGPLSYKLGFDAYRLQQNATQTITDRDTGQIHHNMHPVWPDAEMTNIGGYAQVVYDHGRNSFGGTVRIDREQARVGGVTQFFADNAVPDHGLHAVHDAGHGASHRTTMLLAGDQFAQNNTNVSAAANASLRVTDTWLVTLGVGRAVRSPSALERYADRFPAVKFQTAAEFMGNPLLVPEKSLEVNAGTTLRVARATLEGDVFWRAIDDYITVAHDPNLTQTPAAQSGPGLPLCAGGFSPLHRPRSTGGVGGRALAEPARRLVFRAGRGPAVRRAAVRHPAVRAALRGRHPQCVPDALGRAPDHQHGRSAARGGHALRAADRRLDDNRPHGRGSTRRRRDAPHRRTQPDRRVLHQPPELAESVHRTAHCRNRPQRVRRTGIRLLRADAGLRRTCRRECRAV